MSSRSLWYAKYSPRLDSAHLLVIIGHLNTVQNGFRSGDLVRPHNHKNIFRSENAVPGQYGKEGMLGKESLGEIHKVENIPISPICPVTGELKGIAGLPTFFRPDAVSSLIWLSLVVLE